MSRTAPLILSVAAYCLIDGVTSVAQAQGAIPDYFFKEWTVSKDCTERHSRQGHVTPGLQYRISRDLAAEDGSYTLEAIDGKGVRWPGTWNGTRLEYRAGAKMSWVPADFACVPGEEQTSPFLAMSNYSVSAEPYYEHEHWYGLVVIHGELHHALIFPREFEGASSAIIVLHDADASDGIQLDTDGTIHSED